MVYLVIHMCICLRVGMCALECRCPRGQMSQIPMVLELRMVHAPCHRGWQMITCPLTRTVSAFHHGTTAPSPAQNVLEAYFLPACDVTENYG